LSKQNNISEFDELFKQSFEGASNAVPPGVWEGISSATSAAAGASSASILSKIFGIKGAAIIGSVAVLVTTAIVLNNNLTKTEEVEKPAIVLEKSAQKEVVQPSLQEVSETIKDSETKELNVGPVANKSAEASTKMPEGNQKVTEQITADITDNNPDNGQKVTTPAVEKAVITLNASKLKSCVNQKVNFNIQSNVAISQIIWSLDGRDVKSNGAFASFLLEKPGKHVIAVRGETKKGQLFSVEKSVQTESASARFRVDQKAGIVTLKATRPLKENQWFANQVLIKENQPSVEFKTTDKQVTFVHMMTDLNGCKDTAKQVVNITRDCSADLFIPNIFTPYAQDGINDEFVIDLAPVDGYRLTVYNSKDGKAIFDTENQSTNWNGRYENIGALVPAGYYIYRLVYQCNGETASKQDRVMVSEAKN
jgi:hypothetical protein